MQISSAKWITSTIQVQLDSKTGQPIVLLHGGELLRWQRIADEQRLVGSFPPRLVLFTCGRLKLLLIYSNHSQTPISYLAANTIKCTAKNDIHIDIYPDTEAYI